MKNASPNTIGSSFSGKKMLRHESALDLSGSSFWQIIGDEHLLWNLEGRKVFLAKS